MKKFIGYGAVVLVGFLAFTLWINVICFGHEAKHILDTRAMIMDYQAEEPIDGEAPDDEAIENDYKEDVSNNEDSSENSNRFAALEVYTFDRMFSMDPDKAGEEYEVADGGVELIADYEEEELLIVILNKNKPIYYLRVIDYKQSNENIKCFQCEWIKPNDETKIPAEFFFSYTDDSGTVVPENFFLLIYEDPEAEYHDGYGFGNIARLK